LDVGRTSAGRDGTGERPTLRHHRQRIGRIGGQSDRTRRWPAGPVAWWQCRSGLL